MENPTHAASFHALSTEQALAALKTSERGLSSAEAEKRLKQTGLNALREKPKPHWIFNLLAQFKSFLVAVLIIAAGISAFLGEWIDFLAITAIVILNAILGFLQERKAEKAIEALKRLMKPQATVIRDGRVQEINAQNIVPGDLLIIETGDRIQADCRIIESASLRMDESSLTGESNPVSKHVEPLIEKTALPDRKNMVYSSTIAEYGRAKALVTATGMGTEVGKIAKLLEEAQEEPAPIQIEMASVGKRIAIAVLFICGLIFLTGVWQGKPLQPMFLTAVSLAVAAIPEGLPAVITITFAIGLNRLAGKKAIIRKLPAVETLGSTNVICSDKTGTLTRDEMLVEKLYANNATIDVTGEGYKTVGKFSKPIEKHFELLLKIGLYCNNAVLQNQENNTPKLKGDPTEGALLVSALKAGLKPTAKRVAELPFDSMRKRMTVIIEEKSKRYAMVKGASESLVKLCDKIYENGKIKPLNAKDKREIEQQNSLFAAQGLRVLGFAFREVSPKEKTGIENIERNLVFVGLQGMMDAARAEARDAIAQCESAGIRVIMITGDHKLTAVAVAKQLGLPEGKALTGEELDALSDAQLEKTIDKITVYARVSPEHKIRIVRAWKKRGNVTVAMTGDGTNDAPALKEADIGVAMGITGTDVSKEASDMVLTDDNFATIVKAVEEGRGIYDNITKFIKYLMSSNTGEVLIIGLAVLLNFAALPLQAVQLLWINLVTDGLPAIALGLEPVEKDVMKRAPRPKTRKILDKRTFLELAMVGIVTALLTLWLFVTQLPQGVAKAQTIAFTGLVVMELLRAYNFKTTGLVLGKQLLSNKWLHLAVLSSLALQLAVVYLPELNAVFDTIALDASDWTQIAIAGTASFIITEAVKIALRRKQ